MGQNIIFDIDETLLHTYQDPNKFDAYTPSKGEFKFTEGPYLGVIRPNTKSFLSWCIANFDNIGVWSAGKRDYVEIMSRLLFRGKKPVFVWTWDHCDEIPVGRSSIYQKPVEFIFDTYPSFTPKNTWFIDDMTHSCEINAGNQIIIPAYNPEVGDTEPDKWILKLKKYLIDHQNVDDVRLVAKTL